MFIGRVGREVSCKGVGVGIGGRVGGVVCGFRPGLRADPDTIELSFCTVAACS